MNTPDPSTAKRGRSEEQQTPIARRRTASPEQEFGTPVWRAVQAKDQGRGETGRAEGEVIEKLDWNKSMEEEQATANLSMVDQKFEEFGANAETTEGTDGTENIDDTMINRMIQTNIDLRGEEDKGEQSKSRNATTVPGVSSLSSANISNISQDQLINIIQQTIATAVKNAIAPIVKEMNEMRKQIMDNKGLTQNVQNSLSTPTWPTLKTQGAIPKVGNNVPSQMETALNMANRCVGLGPISEETVNLHSQDSNPALDSHTRNQIGGAFAIRDFLCKEMGMSDSEAENMRIIRTFRIKEQEENLFVEFGTESNLRKVRSKVANLTNGKENDPRLSTYVPKHLQPQYARLVIRANRGRAQTPKQSSKIWLGEKGFELRFRLKGDFTPWSKIDPVNESEQGTNPRRMNIISERSLPNNGTTTSNINENWLLQKPKTPNPSPMTRFNNNSSNPNLIPVNKDRKRNTFLGETLLPRPITTSNSFEILQRTNGTSP